MKNIDTKNFHGLPVLSRSWFVMLDYPVFVFITVKILGFPYDLKLHQDLCLSCYRCTLDPSEAVLKTCY